MALLVVGNRQVVPVIIDGLRKLEYRGYDSAGIAVVDEVHDLKVRRAEGKLRNLEEAIRLNPLDGTYGIGHTRWATHGRPTEENAHPHRDCTGHVVVVHNGIIENYTQLKERLRARDHRFVTETDTEVVAHLIEEHLKQEHSLERAVRRCVSELRGIFALAILSTDEPDTIIAVRQGPPVVIGLGDGEYFVASDIPPILQHTRDIFFLGDGEIAVLTRDAVRVMDFDGNAVEPKQRASRGTRLWRKRAASSISCEGDLRAAPRHPRHRPGPHLARHGPRLPRSNEHHRDRV
ncbi:MAG: class II glutamine amidotransferase [Pyrinomonadaceae bacterium]